MSIEDQPLPTPPVTLEELTDLARFEQWDTIDAVLPRVCNNPAYTDWAPKGLDDENGQVRDLAASVLEATEQAPEGEAVASLTRVMQEDDNPYAQYRSAFALFKHGSRDVGVIAKLKEALRDEDVADIAQSYLDQLHSAA